jgi:hypothetical protein
MPVKPTPRKSSKSKPLTWATTHKEGLERARAASEAIGAKLGVAFAEESADPSRVEGKKRVARAIVNALAEPWAQAREKAGLPEEARRWTPEQTAIALGLWASKLGQEDGDDARAGALTKRQIHNLRESWGKRESLKSGDDAFAEWRRTRLRGNEEAGRSESDMRAMREAFRRGSREDSSVALLSMGVELAMGEASEEAWAAIGHAAADAERSDEQFAKDLAAAMAAEKKAAALREQPRGAEPADNGQRVWHESGRMTAAAIMQTWKTRVASIGQGGGARGTPATENHRQRVADDTRGLLEKMQQKSRLARGEAVANEEEAARASKQEPANPWLDAGFGLLVEPWGDEGAGVAARLRKGWAAVIERAEKNAIEAARGAAWAFGGFDEATIGQKAAEWMEAERERTPDAEARSLEREARHMSNGGFGTSFVLMAHSRAKNAFAKEVARLLAAGQAPDPDPLGDAAHEQGNPALEMARWLRSASMAAEGVRPRLARASRARLADWAEEFDTRQHRARQLGWKLDSAWAVPLWQAVDDSAASWSFGSKASPLRHVAHGVNQAFGPYLQSAEKSAKFAAKLSETLREEGFASSLEAAAEIAGPEGDDERFRKRIMKTAWAETLIMDIEGPGGEKALSVSGLLRLAATPQGWVALGPHNEKDEQRLAEKAKKEAASASAAEALGLAAAKGPKDADETRLGEWISECAQAFSISMAKAKKERLDQKMPVQSQWGGGWDEREVLGGIWSSLKASATLEGGEEAQRRVSNLTLRASAHSALGKELAAAALIGALGERLDAWFAQEGRPQIGSKAVVLFGPEPNSWNRWRLGGALRVIGQSPEQAERMLAQGGVGAFALSAAIAMGGEEGALDERLEQRVKALMGASGAMSGAGWRLLAKMSPETGARLGEEIREWGDRSSTRAQTKKEAKTALREIGHLLEELARANLPPEQAEALLTCGERATASPTVDAVNKIDAIVRFPMAITESSKTERQEQDARAQKAWAERIEREIEAAASEKRRADVRELKAALAAGWARPVEPETPEAAARRHETLRALGEWALKKMEQAKAGAAEKAGPGARPKELRQAERDAAIEARKAIREGLKDLEDWARANPDERERLPRRFGVQALFARSKAWHDELARVRSLKGPEKIAAQITLSAASALAAGHAPSREAIDERAQAASWPMAIERIDGKTAIAQRLAEQRGLAARLDNGEGRAAKSAQAAEADFGAEAITETMAASADLDTVAAKKSAGSGGEARDPQIEAIESEAAASPLAGWQAIGLASEQALLDEGAGMSHCVGSYGEACAKALSRIFRVVDPSGKPVGTLELRAAGESKGQKGLGGATPWTVQQYRGSHNQSIQNADALEFAEEVARAYTRAMALNRAELARAAKTTAQPEGGAEEADARSQLAGALGLPKERPGDVSAAANKEKAAKGKMGAV